MARITEQDRCWLIGRLIDGEEMQAPADSATDKKLRKLARNGVLTCYDAMFGFHYYSFTPEGRQALMGKIV